MGTTAQNVAAARTLVAGLRLLLEYGERAEMPMLALASIREVADTLEQSAPPWKPEPGPSAERRWSEVIPGDKVLAPNGTWYPVESVARIGDKVRALIIAPDGTKIPTSRSAGDVVKVERGDEGRAVDVFAAGGISLELIGAGQ